MRDCALHYSEHHRYVLAFCAAKANYILWDRYELHVDPEELMAEGWWSTLRHNQPDDLGRRIRYTILNMVNYAVSFYLQWNGRARARGILTMTGEDGIDSLPDLGPDPSQRCEIQDTVDFLRRNVRAPVARAGFGYYVEGKTDTVQAEREHVTHQAISARRKEFLKRARALLEV